MRPYVILEAPSILGLRPSGVEELPDALLRAGLAAHLSAAHAGRVEPLPYSPARDASSGVCNTVGLGRYAERLAAQLDPLLAGASFPIVLGGDCSIMLGIMLALRRRGRFGLLFLDGHADFYAPTTSPSGEAADMDLALVTGHGPDELTELGGLRPLVLEEDTVAFGHRDAHEARLDGAPSLASTAITSVDLEAIREVGLHESMSRSLHVFERRELAGFWIHLDVDVMNAVEMPAVDYLMPDGLSMSDVAAVIRRAIETGRAAGLDVTIFNPRLDPQGTVAHNLVDTLRSALIS